MPSTNLHSKACPELLPCGPPARSLTWRHDRALKLIHSFMVNHHPNTSIYCDLDGLQASIIPPSTIPPNVISTTARPDLTIITASKITMVELTVAWNSEDNLTRAHHYKNQKENYQLLLSDIHNIGRQAELVTIEIGSLDHHTDQFYRALKVIAPMASKSDRTNLRDCMAKCVISSSYTIFNAHKSSAWAMSV